jgi:lysozyme family protein
MRGNFERCLSDVLKHEGGWSDHPSDPGGATQKGVTIGTYRRYKPGATKEDLRNITDADLQRIYRDSYWDKVRGDDLPSGVDYAVMDFAVNSGPARAAMFLQEIVGVASDGKIGPLTLKAIDGWDAVALIEALTAKRLAFLKKLSTWTTFGKGWSSRVTGVLRLAKDMAITMPGRPAAPSKPPPQPTTTQPAKSPLAALVAVLVAAIVAAFAFLKSNGVLP